MDPIAHTLTGAALAGTGLRRATPLATATLILGANAPDIDAVLMFAGDYMDLAHRRGLTHGLPAMVVLIFGLTGLMLLWDKYVRLRFSPAALPARAGPLLLLAAIGVSSHPFLDWLNNYGMRWLMPFDDRWSYGDALFIIDPWVWLLLGGMCFLLWSQHRRALMAWGVFWLMTSLVILTSALATTPTKTLWSFGVVALLAIRWQWPVPPRGQVVQTVLLIVMVYMGGNALANLPARSEVRAVLEAAGHGPIGDVMIGPTPANPFRGHVVATGEYGYYLGDWDWFATPRFDFSGQMIEKNMALSIVREAAEIMPAPRFLVWARFPYAEIGSDGRGKYVRFGDARYPGERGPARGPKVYLSRPDESSTSTD